MTQVGKPIKKTTIEPIKNPVPEKVTVPDTIPVEPEKVPA